ncbi:MAG: FAD-binding protein [Candidatus Omnitrophica bacterium]|nr:FAD-binding protein [Candidatus Omnitrophota bacterium]
MSFQEQIISTDLLVVGAGIAGLTAVQEVVKQDIQAVAVFAGAGASPGIMGFNAALAEKDSRDIYFKDTMLAGCGLNNRALVWIMVDEAESALKELETKGLVFDKKEGRYDQLQALGCSYPRVVHDKNVTGPRAIELMTKEIENSSNIKMLKGVSVAGLLTKENKITGALGLDKANSKVIIFNCKAIILATGGCGRVYSFTTYPAEALGHGYAMAYEAGAELVDMEFIQFEPCVLVYPDKLRGFGMITTLLSEGGQLRNIKGERFMERYCPEAEKTQKDILARAIYEEIQAGRGTENGGVYFDVSMLSSRYIEEKYPSYLSRLLSAGIDMRSEPFEVALAAHSCMGGIKINEKCETSVKGLYAAGETAGGVHGANRIGGNAGTEVFVFGRRAGKYAAEYILSEKKDDLSAKMITGQEKQINKQFLNHAAEKKGIYKQFLNPDIDNPQNPDIIKSEIQDIMSEYANIVRDKAGLKKALNCLTEVKDKITSRISANNITELMKAYQVKNMAVTSEIIVKSALTRTESRGAHYRKDFPERDDKEWLKNVVIRKVNGKSQTKSVKTEG